jgi:hypothetical protein
MFYDVLKLLFFNMQPVLLTFQTQYYVAVSVGSRAKC